MNTTLSHLRENIQNLLVTLLSETKNADITPEVLAGTIRKFEEDRDMALDEFLLAKLIVDAEQLCQEVTNEALRRDNMDF